jgi:hypothetical protein
MPEEKTNIVETELEIASAMVETVGKVTIYHWDVTAKGHYYHTWNMGPVTQPINGGVHVHGWDSVYLTDTYPSDSTHWKVGVENREGHDVKLTIYLLALT